MSKPSPSTELVQFISQEPQPFNLEGMEIPLVYPTKAEAEHIIGLFDKSREDEQPATSNNAVVETTRAAIGYELTDEQAWSLLQRAGGVDGELAKRCSEVCFGIKDDAEETNDDPT